MAHDVDIEQPFGTTGRHDEDEVDDEGALEDWWRSSGEACTDDDASTRWCMACMTWTTEGWDRHFRRRLHQECSVG